ncbi:MAG: hypothetical protein LBQ40_04525 [Clostridiales bacterium]|jgi:hypothetical protein|nr:hypothetical protein [Clostridiales bacterium]
MTKSELKKLKHIAEENCNKCLSDILGLRNQTASTAAFLDELLLSFLRHCEPEGYAAAYGELDKKFESTEAAQRWEQIWGDN